MGCAGSSPTPSTCCCLINIHYTMRRISLDVSKEAVALGILEVLKVSPSDVPCASAYGSEKLPASDLVTVYPLPYQEDLRQMLFMTTGLFVAVTMDRRSASGYFHWDLFDHCTLVSYSGVRYFEHYDDALADGLQEAFRLLK